jgi:hypothetical protein
MKILLALLVFVSFGFAQSQPSESDAEKQKKAKELDEKVVQMLEQIIADAPTLRLAQNRAVVYGIAGDLYWKFDEKRAREIFRSCTGEILAANVEWERDVKNSDNPFGNLFSFSTIRNDVLPLVAKHDGELALEMLLQTRPASLSEAIAKASGPNAKADDYTFSRDRQLVRMELDLEQRFALLAADTDPDKAIKLIKDSLARGISYNVLMLLQKLNRKDEKKAADLAGDVVGKVIDTDLTKKSEDLSAVIGFLQYSTRTNPAGSAPSKEFRFSDSQVKDLANKLVSTFLQPGISTSILIGMTRIMPTLEKIVPERIAMLKMKQADAMKNLPADYKRMQDSQRLWDPNTAPEDILAQLSKLNDMEKANAYSTLPSKISQIDDEVRAKKLIAAIPDEKTRERASDMYESAKINKVSREGKLEDARRLIGNIGQKKVQVQRLVALAVECQMRGGDKNLEFAQSLMKDAKSLVSEFPEDGDELTDLLEVVRGYAVIDPAEGFRLFEPIVDQINDVVQATAVLSKYDKRNMSFRRGELVLKVSGFQGDSVILFRCIPQMQMLGKADLEKMSLLSDRFIRPDSRIITKLYVAQGFLSDDKKLTAGDNGSGSGSGVIIMND